MYEDGEISREEYLKRKEQNEREIASWQMRTTKTEELAMQLGMCVQAVDVMNRLWETSDDEDKQGMVRHLFDYIVFDLDKQQIVDFRLKAWADRFVTLRASLYEDSEGNQNPSNSVQGVCTHVTPTGLDITRIPSMNSAIQRVLDLLYLGVPRPTQSVLPEYLSKSERNEQIRVRYADGESIADLAREYGISNQRVFQIIHRLG